MHTKDAAHAGETSVRLDLVAAWREATVFTDAERAALELAEQGTRIADAAGGVSDDAWLNAAKYYDEEQLAALVRHDRPHQRLQPHERHRAAARRRLPARSVRDDGYERVASSARWRSELVRWSTGNGGNVMCSRTDDGTADQS